MAEETPDNKNTTPIDEVKISNEVSESAVEIVEGEEVEESNDKKVDDITSSDNSDDKKKPSKVKKGRTSTLKEKDDDVAVSDDVIEDVYQHLKTTFVKNFQDAAYKSMLECGQYLVQKFYGTYEKAQEKKFTRTESMSKLIKKIRDNASDDNVPSRTWIYDAVNLAIDNYLFEQKQLPSAYGQLGHSQKVNLTYAPDLKCKINLIKTLDEPTVTKIREGISKAKKKKDNLSLEENISENKLKDLTEKRLKSYQEKIKRLQNEIEKKSEIYRANLEVIQTMLKKRVGKREMKRTSKNTGKS